MLLTELNQCDIMLLKGSSISATLRRTMLLDLEKNCAAKKAEDNSAAILAYKRTLFLLNKCDIRLVQT